MSNSKQCYFCKGRVGLAVPVCLSCASKAKVEQQADNTGSPKLPGLEESIKATVVEYGTQEQYITEAEKRGAKYMYEFLARQLRAGA